jgi:hypothetical protein
MSQLGMLATIWPFVTTMADDDDGFGAVCGMSSENEVLGENVPNVALVTRNLT